MQKPAAGKSLYRQCGKTVRTVLIITSLWYIAALWVIFLKRTLPASPFLSTPLRNNHQPHLSVFFSSEKFGLRYTWPYHMTRVSIKSEVASKFKKTNRLYALSEKNWNFKALQCDFQHFGDKIEYEKKCVFH